MFKLPAFLMTTPGKVICFLILGLYYRSFLKAFFKYYDEYNNTPLLKRILCAALLGFAQISFRLALSIPIIGLASFSLFMTPINVETEYKTVTREVVYSNYDEAYDAGYERGYSDAYEEIEDEKEEAEEHKVNNIRGY